MRRISGSKAHTPGPYDPTLAPESAPPAGRSKTIHAGWLIDGSGGPVRRHVRLEVRNGLIQTMEDEVVFSCGAHSSRSKPELDFSGCTLIPGLIDSHVHLTLTGDVDEVIRKSLREAPYEVIRQMIVDNLQEHLRHGVVAVRDGGGCRGNALRFAKSQQGQAQPVRVQAAGRAWHREGRYGRLIGRAPASGRVLAEAIRKDDEPADHIKIVNSGLNSLSEYGRQTAPQFNLTEMSAAVRAAAGRGLSVMVHANGEAPVRIAAMAGCRSVEHGFFMGPENLSRLADQGITWVPTAVTMQAYAEVFKQAGKNPDVARRTLNHQLDQLAIARRLGVNVALGTDAGTPGVHHGAAVIAEMKLMIQAGFTLPEAVRCASQNAARLAGADCGLLDRGRPATFIAVEAEPSALPEKLRHIRAVFINGERELDAG
jgi:imidazolonepropionase-like amidohydrolase